MQIVWENGRCWIANRHGTRVALVGLSGHIDAEGRVKCPVQYAGDTDLIATKLKEALNGR